MAIQDKNVGYDMLNWYMKSIFKLAYSKVEYHGVEKIPQAGAVIFAPNHTNALMDALAVLTIAKRPTVFVARADIFKKKTVARILTWLKIMPIMRIRDGRANLGKNAEIMKKSVEVLKSNIPFCIMAEGTQRPKHSLLPLVKGIFRIALQTNEDVGGEVPVYIVPVGIEYGNYFRFRHSLLVNVGDAINVTEFVEQHKDLEQAEVMMVMRELLSEKMAGQIHYVEDTERYEALLDISYLCNREVLEGSDLLSRLKANRKVQEVVKADEDKIGELSKRLVSTATEFAKMRREKKIEDTQLYSVPTMMDVFWKLIILVAAIPYFMYSAVVSLPMILVSEGVCSLLEDTDFYNSVRFFFMMIFLPCVLAVSIVLTGCVFGWIYVPIVVPLTVAAYSFVHYYLETMRHVKSSIVYMRNKQLGEMAKNIVKDFILLKK